MKSHLKAVAFFCLYYSGLEWLFARIIRVRAVAILMYHGVCDRPPIPPSINFHLDPRVFERQMRALKRRYEIRPIGDVVAALRSGKPLKKAIALTFDDGYRNNAQNVAPVLKRLGVPFTVFVSTQYIGTGRWMPLNQIYWSWSLGNLGLEEMRELRTQIHSRPAAEIPRLLNSVDVSLAPASRDAEDSFAMLNWDEIRDMERAGAEFGSHTHSHCNMGAEEESQQKQELLVSKELLERNLHRSITSFAYPYGKSENMSETSYRNVINAGFECAVSAEYGLVTERSDRFCLPRLGYDHRIWFFTGEIVYQFTKQALKDVWSKLPSGVHPKRRLEMETSSKTSDSPRRCTHIMHVVRTGLAGGGMENGIINVANRLPDDQYKISVCALDQAETFSQLIQRRNSEYYLVPPVRSGVDSSLVWRLARLLRQSKTDVVHSHNWGTFLYAILAAKLARVPLIHSDHGKNPTEFGRESPHKRWTKSLLGPRVDRLVTVSRALAAEWNDYGVPATKILNIPNGVDVERFCPRPVNGEERRKFGLPPDGFLFGSVGRLDSLKNYELLIMSFVRIASKLPSSRLALLGEGPCTDRLKRKIDELKLNNIVYLIGRRSDPENFLRSLDLFVLPSKYEGMSNVVLEAMATGLAVVCADLPSHREVLEPDREGVVVSPLTVEKLAEVLVALACNSKRCRELGSAAREKVVKRFTLARMVLDYEQLYASLAAH